MSGRGGIYKGPYGDDLYGDFHRKSVQILDSVDKAVDTQPKCVLESSYKLISGLRRRDVLSLIRYTLQRHFWRVRRGRDSSRTAKATEAIPKDRSPIGQRDKQMSSAMTMVGLLAEPIKADSQREAVASTPSVKPRICAGCNEPIPMNRLLAKPNARLCVHCQIAVGDVPPLRRFDEYAGEDIVSTVYVDDRKVLEEQGRHNRAVASRFYESAVGDDSFLERETGPGIGTLGLANAQYADDIS